MEGKSTLRRLVISNFSKEGTEPVLQIIHVLFCWYVPFGTKEQENLQKMIFQYF